MSHDLATFAKLKHKMLALMNGRLNDQQTWKNVAPRTDNWYS